MTCAPGVYLSISTSLLFLLASFFGPIGSVYAQGQCTQKLSELPAAAELLGFHLGMTRDEVTRLVPRVTFGKTDEFGVSKTTINPYFDSQIDKARFTGIRSISLDFLDERLTSLWIGYDDTFKVQAADDFVSMISRSLHLPGGWSSWKSRGQQLRCVDFQLIVTTLAGGPSLRILDTTAEDTIAARRQAKEERDSATEAAVANSDEELPEVIADRVSRIYYPPGCAPTREVAAANRVIFKTIAEAEKAGFKPAKNCH